MTDRDDKMNERAPDGARLLLERYFDGELAEPSERARAEELLERDPDARAYLERLERMHAMVAMPVEEAARAVDFDALADRVMASTVGSEARARNPELEMLAMAYADGELPDAADRARVEEYLASQPAAREGVEAIGQIGQLVALPVEMAADTVDFDALSRRIQGAVAADAAAREEATRSAARAAEDPASLWQRIVAFFDAHRAVLASAVTAALVAAVISPMLVLRGGDEPRDRAQAVDGEQAPVINNYYISYPQVESIETQTGYSGSVPIGTGSTSPVIWIVPTGHDSVQEVDADVLQVPAPPDAGNDRARPEPL